MPSGRKGDSVREEAEAYAWSGLTCSSLNRTDTKNARRENRDVEEQEREASRRRPGVRNAIGLAHALTKNKAIKKKARQSKADEYQRAEVL
jgi:hypothetical protein